MNLSGRYVLLTGGSRGLGPGIAAALARRGAHVALTARSEEGLHRSCVELQSYGVRTLAVPADLARATERERLVEEVLGAFGRIDVLVNNAALETEGAFAEQSWEALQGTIEVNLAAPVHLTRLVLPLMLAQSQGHVVQLSSLAGKAGTPYDALYSGTKAALARWTEGVRRELAGTGVGFSTISPGYVTGRGMFARFGIEPPALLGSCTPQDVARAVVEAIEHERRDVIVNTRPVRPLIAMAELFPTLGDWMMHRIGIVEFQRRKASAARDPTPDGV